MWCAVDDIQDVPGLAGAEVSRIWRSQRGHRDEYLEQRDSTPPRHPPSLPQRPPLERLHHPAPLLHARRRRPQRRGPARRVQLEIRCAPPPPAARLAAHHTNDANAGADASYADFPGIYAIGKAFSGPRPNPQTHPHLRLERTMTSVPRVSPGDTVFWHCVRPRSPSPHSPL